MKKANYRLNEDGTIMEYCIDPFHEGEPFIVVEDDVIIHPGFDKVINGEYIPDPESCEADRIHREQKANVFTRISRLKSYLVRSDAEILKYVEGLLSEEEFESVKKQRRLWREEIAKLEADSHIKEQSSTSKYTLVYLQYYNVYICIIKKRIIQEKKARFKDNLVFSFILK